MKIYYSEIKNIYGIKIKSFEPENKKTGYILALHGFCGDMESSVIKQLAKRMTPHGFAVVAFNFPGHGTSEADDYFSLYNCRKDMFDVINYVYKEYGFEYPAAIFATSFGGYVTLLNHDKLPSNIVYVLRSPAVNMKASFEKFADDMEGFRQKGWQEMGFSRKLKVSYRFYEELENNDIRNDAELGLQSETLVIHGDQDVIVLPSDMQWFYRKHPLIKLEVIEGADHRFIGNDYLEKIIDLSEEHILHVLEHRL